MENKEYKIPVSKDKPEYWKAFLRFVILETSLDKVTLQRKRIEIAKNSTDLKVLFADIHFFLVAITNVMECLKSLKTILKTDSGLNAIYKKYVPQLKHLKSFRDNLEHITDGRLEGFGKHNQPLKNSSMLGNLLNDNYNFGGEFFNLVESFSMIDNLYTELREWNKVTNVYPLWTDLTQVPKIPSPDNT